MIDVIQYNAVNVSCRELAPGTVSLTGDRAQGDDNKHWAYSTPGQVTIMIMLHKLFHFPEQNG